MRFFSSLLDSGGMPGGDAIRLEHNPSSIASFAMNGRVRLPAESNKYSRRIETDRRSDVGLD